MLVGQEVRSEGQAPRVVRSKAFADLRTHLVCVIRKCLEMLQSFAQILHVKPTFLGIFVICMQIQGVESERSVEACEGCVTARQS